MNLAGTDAERDADADRARDVAVDRRTPTAKLHSRAVKFPSLDFRKRRICFFASVTSDATVAKRQTRCFVVRPEELFPREKSSENTCKS